MTNIKQLLTSLETCLRRSKAFYKKLFDWKPYNLAFKLKIVAEAEAVENNSDAVFDENIPDGKNKSEDEEMDDEFETDSEEEDEK